MRVSILPEDDYVLTYNLYPLLPGFVALPPIQLKATPSDDPHGSIPAPVDQDELNELVSRYVPTHVYVLVTKIIFQLTRRKF